jgi:hypothetical protein
VQVRLPSGAFVCPPQCSRRSASASRTRVATSSMRGPVRAAISDSWRPA